MVKKKKQNKGSEIIMEYDFSKEGGVVGEKEKVEEKKPESCKKPQAEKKSSFGKSEKEVKKEKRKEKQRVEKEKKKEYLRNEIEAPVDEVIEELLNSEKTFVENITRNVKKSIFSSFYPFPKNINFMSIGKKEAVVLIVRHHWTGLVSRGVLAFFALFFPFLISYSVPTWFDSAIGSTFFVVGLFLFFMMLSASILIDGFLKWFFQMNVITTSRIIDVDFVSITTHRVSETTFDQVQDVSHSPAGPFASFFDYGNLYVQTAGAKREFQFHNIPRPRDIQDTILDLRELRRKKFAGIK